MILIFEAQIHIQIHVRYFKSLPIATYYLSTIHIKYLYLHSKTCNMGLEWNLCQNIFKKFIFKSVNPNFRKYQFNRNNNKFDWCFEIQPKTVARISILHFKFFKVIFKSDSYLMSLSCFGPVTPSTTNFPDTNHKKAIGNLLVVSKITE